MSSVLPLYFHKSQPQPERLRLETFGIKCNFTAEWQRVIQDELGNASANATPSACRANVEAPHAEPCRIDEVLSVSTEPGQIVINCCDRQYFTGTFETVRVVLPLTPHSLYVLQGFAGRFAPKAIKTFGQIANSRHPYLQGLRTSLCHL